MNIQDIVITIATIILSVSLIPQIILGFQTKTQDITYITSISSLVSLLFMVVAFASLELWLSAIVTVLNAIPWLIFIIQRFIYTKK
jgi:hypothetical protein